MVRLYLHPKHVIGETSTFHGDIGITLDCKYYDHVHYWFLIATTWHFTIFQ